jgi:hypothetical protein
MKKPVRALATGSIAAALSALAAPVVSAPISITLTQISTPFNSPIGIDHHAPTNSVVVSVHYSGGSPHNFERILNDGTHAQFSAVSGLTDEVKIATVRPGNIGGFTSGDLFTGNGIDGQIVRISNNGATVINPFVDLPGAGNGLMRGSLYVDRTGVFGGDLIAATTAGEVWRITSAGAATKIDDVNVHLEGLLTVPNNAAKWGPIAGCIIAGAEQQGLMHAWCPSATAPSGFAHTTYNLGLAIEDIDLITPNENFFGVNFGSSRILGAPASEFASVVDNILLTQEFPVGSGTGLYVLSWNGSALVAEQVTLNTGSADPAQWEHVTFSSAGIVEIPPIDPNPRVPEPGTLLLIAPALALLLRRKN